MLLSRLLRQEVKVRALGLWLKGLTYRAINEKTGVSLGAVNELVNEARRKEPSLDELKELNVMLKKGDSSVVDAIRGAKILERVNELHVSLGGLESFIKFSERISSERGVEAERFIEASMRLMSLELERTRLS
jgi:transposase